RMRRSALHTPRLVEGAKWNEAQPARRYRRAAELWLTLQMNPLPLSCDSCCGRGAAGAPPWFRLAGRHSRGRVERTGKALMFRTVCGATALALVTLAPAL